jgi:hypothetical protein
MASGVNFSKPFRVRVRVRVSGREGVWRVFGVSVYFRGLGCCLLCLRKELSTAAAAAYDAMERGKIVEAIVEK